jgi:16S rRNA (guanine966-N2)-methyltransferase
MNRPKKTKTKRSHDIRIIGGQWRGRKLKVLDLPGLRPTGDRIKETLFNWLTMEIKGSHCLDLFAGSGALGFESLSRGAASVTMIENNSAAAKNLEENKHHLNASSASVVSGDAIQYLNNQSLENHSIDIVFIDPPFSGNLWLPIIDILNSSKLLSDGAFIYIESPKGELLQIPSRWKTHRTKTSGEVCYQLFQVAID